jgi:hypothetical protein
MPTNKDFKKIIRARMEKTGEAYTTARANLLRHTTSSTASAPVAVPESRKAAAAPVALVESVKTAPVPVVARNKAVTDSASFAKVAGMSDAAVKKATGCTWDKWVFVLDHVGADSWSHRAIAEYVHDAYKVPDWWTQMVTVGYERIKGLRAKGQRRDGGFEANKSRSFAAPAARVFRAFAQTRERRKWLPDAKVVIKRATPNRSIRMTWDDGTPVEVWITSKGRNKTTAQVQHRKLVSKEDADRRKAFWAERLAALTV